LPEPPLLIMAALAEELESALRLCRARTRVDVRGLSLSRARCRERTCFFLRTGIGPVRALASLQAALKIIAPSSLLITGYAGALDPALKNGDLIVARRASLLAGTGSLEAACTLEAPAAISDAASAQGLRVHVVDLLTAGRPVVSPADKSALYRRHGMAALDMETAVLAGAAAGVGLPVICVRAVADEAEDALEAVSARAVCRSEAWQARAHVALQSLRKFFQAFL
jgi:nucleoside phosphorylase